MSKHCKKAFTLAEVLLTLAIIGVVAAMSIPALIANTNKQEYVIALKKSYVTFNAALAKYSVENGCVNSLRCTGIFNNGNVYNQTGWNKAGDAIAPYFNVVKNCRDSGTGCFSTQVSQNYDGSSDRSDWDAGGYKFITADGVAYKFDSMGTNCAYNAGYTDAKEHMVNICGNLTIDVNGPNKGPNNYGRDIYKFFITDGKGPLIYPRGGEEMQHWKDINNDLVYCFEGNLDGFNCAGRILEENWQMNY